MKRVPIALTLLALLSPVGPTLAEATTIDPAAAACAALTSDADRLACYDGLFRPSAIPSSVLVLQSEQTILARPSGRANATLSLSCSAGVPRLEFAFAGNPLSATGANIGISVQRDLRSSRALSLRPSADGTGGIMDQRADLETFVQSLQGVGALSLQTRTTDYRSLTVRFQIGPRASDLSAALAACR